ncbi:MAG: GTP-binding protein [Ruminococcaceae bacterium]|nr:GTP-binding protein [Oscillospiraceae bacterium]
MTKIDIFSGFLGAGKTTLIKKLITEAYAGEKLVLIENEFGEIGIDGGFLAEAGIQINEMNSGCICCSLVGDFSKALSQVLTEYAPDRILIEPSGVGKLSDVIRAVQGAATEGAVLGGFTTVVDAGKCRMYMKNFGEFFNDQVENAGCIILSHTQTTSAQKIETAISLLREHNPTAVIVTTPWDELTGAQLREAMERKDTLEAELARLAEEAEHHHHHHHDHDDHDDHDEEHHHHHEDGEECHCHEHEHEHHHHHHEDGEECHCHEHEHEHHHHHHEDGEECHCHDHEHEHHHHHEDGEECHCHDHEHHHHHHHADEVFVSCGAETTATFDPAAMADKLAELTDEDKYGIVLRAKGIVPSSDGAEWIHFDYVPGEPDVRTGAAAVIGRLCVIGSKLNIPALSELFGVELA